MSCSFKDEDFATVLSQYSMGRGMGSASREQVTGQEGTASNCARECLGWI